MVRPGRASYAKDLGIFFFCSLVKLPLDRLFWLHIADRYERGKSDVRWINCQ